MNSRFGSGRMMKSSAPVMPVDEAAASPAAPRGPCRPSGPRRARGRAGSPGGRRSACGERRPDDLRARAPRRAARLARRGYVERLGQQVAQVEHLDVAVAQRLREARRAPPARARPTGRRRTAARRCCAGSAGAARCRGGAAGPCAGARLRWPRHVPRREGTYPLQSMKLEGIHHITAITGDAPANVDFYVGVARPAAGQEDGQPGRPDRLPPVLRRRGRQPGGGPDVLRVPGRRRGRAGDGMVHRIVWRVGVEASLDFWERAAGAPRAWPRRARRRPALRRPRGAGARAAWSTDARDAPLAPTAPDVPRRARAAGLRRGARVRLGPGARVRRCCATTLGFDGGAGGRLGVARRRARVRSSTTRRRRSAASQGAGTVHHVAWASRLDDQDAWRAAGRPCRRAPDAGHRPLLLPLGLLPRAERGAVRARDDRPRLRGRRAARARSASGCRCRRRSSTAARRSSGR